MRLWAHLVGSSCELMQEADMMKVFLPRQKICHKKRFIGDVSCGLGFLCSGNNSLATKRKNLLFPCYLSLFIPWWWWHMLLPLVWNAFYSPIVSLKGKSSLWHLSGAFAKVHMVSEVWSAEVFSMIRLPNNCFSAFYRCPTPVLWKKYAELLK